MIMISWALAGLLLFEVTAPAAKCEPADNGCKAARFVALAKSATTDRERALYLHAAHRSYLFLFDTTGGVEHLCAARRAFDQSLAIRDQPDSQRASFEAVRADLTSRERKAGARCGSTVRQSRPKPRVLAAQTAAPPTPTAGEVTPPPEVASAPELVRPVANTVEALPPPTETANAPDLVRPVTSTVADDGLLPITRGSSARTPSPITQDSLARTPGPPPSMRRGRDLMIAGGVTLAFGFGVAGAAGYTGARLAETNRNVRALRGEVEGHATDDQLARDDALTHDYRRFAPMTIAFAVAGGATVIVAAVLLGVGGRRMRAASYATLVPIPGGLAFYARF